MGKRLNGLVRDFAYWLRSEDGQELIQEWDERQKRYGELLKEEAKIDALSEEEVGNLFANLWSIGFARNKEKVARQIVEDNGLERVKEWLKDLIARGEKGLLPKDFDDLVKGLKRVGHAMLSELLCLCFPERYWIWNNPLNDAINRLERYGVLKWEQPSKITEGQKYFAYQKVLDSIISAMREVSEISEALGREPSYYSDADMFVWWIVSKHKILPYDAGEKAEWWEECRDNGCILIEWGKVAQQAPEYNFGKVKDKDEMRKLFQQVYGEQRKGAGGWSQVWRFVHEIKPGDIIVAKTGRDQILGIGIVTSDYIPPDTPEHPLSEEHEWRGARKVDWRIKEPVIVDFDLGAQTLVRENEWNEIVEAYKRKGIDVYERLWGQKSDEQPIQQESESKLAEYFKARGFHFTDKQIATFYAALKTKGFVILSGLSGTGKTKLAQFFAELVCPCQKCHGGESNGETECKCTHLFLSVRPDWRDSKALLGYYNPLTEQYESTPLLRFLLRARNDYEKNRGNAQPYFVILDEMNLSHVEYYFADFLSVLESGRDENGWTKEPLRLYSPDLEKRPDIEQEQGIPPELHLPPNLYIIGTVNIDETTYMFSPKVLDRAFTIEFRDVDFSNYPSSESGDVRQIADQIREAILNDLRNGSKFCSVTADKNEIKQAVEGLGGAKQQLEKLNSQLQSYDLHFGYRVLDEIALFVKHATDEKLPDQALKLSPEKALDYAVLMKVLPKFHGPRQKLEMPLWYVVDWCLNQEQKQSEQQGTEEQFSPQSVWKHIKEDRPPSHADIANLLRDWGEHENKFRYPATAKKALQMLRQLYETGFASFAQ